MFFSVKKWTVPQRRVHYVQYQYFLFYILLIWGVRAHPTHPPPMGLRVYLLWGSRHTSRRNRNCPTCSRRMRSTCSPSSHRHCSTCTSCRSDPLDRRRPAYIHRRTRASSAVRNSLACRACIPSYRGCRRRAGYRSRVFRVAYRHHRPACRINSVDNSRCHSRLAVCKAGRTFRK